MNYCLSVEQFERVTVQANHVLASDLLSMSQDLMFYSVLIFIVGVVWGHVVLGGLGDFLYSSGITSYVRSYIRLRNRRKNG